MLTIIETIGDALKNDKYAMKLSVQETNFMHNLLQDHPEVFRKIQGIVEEIMADGKVDIFDLPNLIRLCSQIYHEHLVGYAIQHVGVISLIQFTLDALLDSGLLPINGVTKDILKKVIDSSLELLNANVSSIPYKTACLRLSHFFQCTKKTPPPVLLPISLPSPAPPAHISLPEATSLPIPPPIIVHDPTSLPEASLLPSLLVPQGTQVPTPPVPPLLPVPIDETKNKTPTCNDADSCCLPR